jgi:type I restriction enzyme S subunit
LTGPHFQSSAHAVPLHEVCLHITDGKHGDCSDQPGSGYYFLSCKDITNDKLNYQGAREITEADFSDTHLRTRFESNDILVTNSGTIGRMAIAPEADLTKRTTFQKSVAILKPDPSAVVPRYLFYHLKSLMPRLVDLAGGTAQKNLLLRDLRGFRVDLPPFPIQRKIVAILSAYDDLIENNNRRIGLLEDMAHRIYRQWFVDFRYPGHESVPLIESDLGPVPEGWSVRPLAGVVDDVRDSVKAGPATVDRPYVPIDCIGARSLALVDCKPGFEAASSLLTFNRGDILFGAMRPYFHKVALAPWTGTTRTTCFVLRVPRASDYSFAVMTLFDERTIEYATSHSSGTTIPYARWKGSLAAKLVVVPDARVMAYFDAAIRPILDLLTDAGARLGNLRGTYDLLLPRLVSGEIDVADLDVLAPELAV